MKQKIYKLLSIVLAFALVFTCCMVAFTTLAEETKEPITYYVSPEGVDADDRGLDDTTPLASVDKAVNLAKAAGYGAGETVYVKVIHVADKSTTWGAAAQITAHAFTLDISSNGDSIAQLGAVDTSMTFNGPTKLSNIKMMWGRSSADKGYPNIDFAGNDVVIGNGLSTYNAEFNLYYAKTGTYDEPHSLTFTGPYNRTVVLGGDWGGPTYNSITTINVAGSGAYTFNVRTANGSSASHATKFNGTFNFNLKSGSASIGFDSNANRVKYGEKSAVQILNSVGADVSTWDTALSTNPGTTKPSKYFIINNTYGADAIEFTETAGKYKVNLDTSKYQDIRIVKADDESVVAYPDEDNFIKVTESGVYTLKASKFVTYYVKPTADATVATGEFDKPFKTLNAAVKAAFDAKYGAGDIVYVKLIKATTTAEDDTVSEVKNMWFDDYAAGYLTSYNFKLNISSYSDTDKATLYTNAGNIGPSGDVDFENVILGFDASNTTLFNFRSSSISFGTGVEFVDSSNLGMMLAWGTAGNRELNYYFETLPSNVYFGGRWSNPTFSNISVTVNDSDLSRTFYLGDHGNGSSITTFNGVLNFNVKDATSLAFANGKGTLVFTENFAAQVINSSGETAIASNAATYFGGKKITNNGTATDTIVPYYIINNFYGKDAIEFTDTAGKYKVNLNPEDYEYLGLVNDADQLVKAEPDEDGYINVAEPGVYTLKAIKSANTTYYVSAGGSDENNGESADDAFATVAKAIAVANTKGLNANDTVNIKATGTITWAATDVTPESYAYTLNIESLDPTTKASVSVGTVTGDLSFDNINITNTSYITIFGNSITLGEDVSISSSATIQLADGTNSLTYPEPVNVIINNAFSGTIHMGNNGQRSPTYAEDVNIIVNNDNASPSITFTTYWGSTKTFKKNLNFIFNKVKGVKFTSPTANGGGNSGTAANNMVVNGAVQIVAPATATIDKVNIDNWLTANPTYKSYYVEKASGVAATLSQSATAGKYWVNIDTDVYEDIALVSADETVTSPLTDGYVAAAATGEYIFKATKKSNLVGTYYVSPNGNDASSGKTADKPLATIGGAIAVASAAGYGEGNTVDIKLIKTVVDGAEVMHKWGTLPSDTAFKVNISSATDKAKVDMSSAVSLKNDTHFANVTLGFKSGSYPVFDLGAKNITFGTGVEYENGGYNNFVITNAGGAQPENINLSLESALPTALRLGGMYVNPTFKNINITLNNGTSSTFNLGCQDDDRIITFDGNLNFNLKNATGLNLSTKTDGGVEVPLTFTKNFAAQFINSTGNAAITDSAVAYLSNKTVDGTETVVPYYVINNNTANKDLIGFTSDAGTYTVNGLEAGKSLWVYNKNGEFVKKAANNSTITLEPGEYNLELGEGSVDYSFDVQEGISIADAIQTAINNGATETDTVTLNVMADTNFGKLPEYNFNLVIKSDNKVTLTVDNGPIANNAGMTTEYKNVIISNTVEWGIFELAHSNAIFHKDASFVENHSKLTFGYNSANPNMTVPHDQTVEINCPTPYNISLTNGINSKKEYSNDVNLIINHKDASTNLLFNAYYENAPHYTTKYNGNVNINIKDAKTINIDSGWDSNVTFGDNSRIQFIVDGSTSFGWDTLATKLTQNGLQEKAVIIVDSTFQRRCADFTETVGTFAIDNPYKVTATKIKNISGGAFVDLADSNKVVKTVENNQFTADFGGNVWELTTNEYFEDFNNTTLDELKADWTFTGRVSQTNYHPNPTVLEDGKLVIPGTNYVLEYGDPNKNYNLKSKEQFISVDLQPENFGWWNGFAIYGRMEGRKGYEFRLRTGDDALSLVKIIGDNDNKNSAGHYLTNLTGLAVAGETDESDGLMEYRPGGNTVGFNSSHIYRMGLSITTDYDKNGKEVALIRGILFDITSNTLIFDETFRDTEPYTGTEVAMYSPHGASEPSGELCYSYVDNFYFSTEKFRTGDDGWCEKDINGDGVYDIRDLVFTGDNLNNTEPSQTILYKADRDSNGEVDNGDITIVRKEILNGLAAAKKTEFKLSGQSDQVAETTRQNILNSTSSYNSQAGTYTATATVREDGKYVTKSATYGNGATIYFVANHAAGSGDGKSANNPMSFASFLASYDTYVKSGNMILFNRGETYRIATETLGTKTGYFTLPGGTTSNPTLFGAYGTGAKPKFTSSAKDYAKDVTWTHLGDTNAKNTNIWVIDAPEFILEGVYDQAPTNIIFDNGDAVGLRKGFPLGLEPAKEKLYTLYKEGDFTYDADNQKLYLYSVGNPSSKYTSIEITRALNGISVKSSNFVVDNLNLRGFKFAIQGSSNNKNLTVTNCEIGFSGGVKRGNDSEIGWGRYANAIEFWDGGADLHVNYNWIYQTWDSAITTQASAGRNHDGMQVKGNLLEYNNCDIEIFDGSGSSRDNTAWTDNIMRFTSLGWGSRNVSRIRDIQGVIRGGVTGATKVSIDWTNNIVDTPGMEFARFTNLTEYTVVNGKTIYSGIFKFGQSYNSTNPSELGNNTYYFNPYVRSRSTTLWQYHDEVPADGIATNPSYAVETKTKFYDVMTKFDDSSTSQFYFLKEKLN